jgi:polysaccharide export outer membrane protein
MPTTGPAGDDIRAGQKDPRSLPYAVVKITPHVESVLAANAPRLGVAFTDRRPPRSIVFGIGDVVSVTIFEAAAGGLFIPTEAGVRPGNFVNLPNQNVDPSGNITVPYAGPIRANGRSPEQIQRDIVDALKDRAIEPQVVVSSIENRSSLISVLGDVNLPARLTANAAGEHILDVIARAGGPKSQGYDEWVILERQGRREIVPFGALVYEPAVNDIWAHKGDTIYLYREPQTFVVLGASQSSVTLTQIGTQFVFDAWRLSLAEGIAKAGGLNDEKAEPGAVFLYRGETRNVAEQLGIDCTPYAGPIIPVVYNLNLRDPAGYFLATKFQMRNKDVIFVSNNITVEATKAMNFFRLVTATVNDPIVTATNAFNLKNVAVGTSSVITSPVTAPIVR